MNNSLIKESLPMVSVCMVTYNQAEYISEAIHGVLMQECNFNIELIIANDDSPDNTDCVIENILKTHQRASIIRHIKHDKNMGMMPNFIFALQQSKSKYIALCDGDDYWKDPLKLQKQVDFLEKNRNYVISCHNSNVINSKGDIVKLFNEFEIPEVSDIAYLLKNSWFMPTASVIFRNNFVLPKWFCNVLNGDYTLYLILTYKGGLIHYQNEIWSAYRRHDHGVSNMFKNNNVMNHSMIYINEKFNKYSNNKFFELCNNNIEMNSFEILNNPEVKSKTFWAVLANFVWFRKGIDRKILKLIKERLNIFFN